MRLEELLVEDSLLKVLSGELLLEDSSIRLSIRRDRVETSSLINLFQINTMASKSCFIIVSRNGIPFYEAEVSSALKVAPMAPRRRSASTPIGTSTEGTLAAKSLAICSSVASASTKRPVRGPTWGKRTERLIARVGKLPVEVPKDCKVPVGPKASAFMNELGKEIRGAAPLQGNSLWATIDPSIRTAIMQRVLDKFDVKDYCTDPDVQESIDKKCATLYKAWKCKLHLKYEKLLEDGVEPNAQPP